MISWASETTSKSPMDLGMRQYPCPPFSTARWDSADAITSLTPHHRSCCMHGLEMPVHLILICRQIKMHHQLKVATQAAAPLRSALLTNTSAMAVPPSWLPSPLRCQHNQHRVCDFHYRQSDCPPQPFRPQSDRPAASNRSCLSCSARQATEVHGSIGKRIKTSCVHANHASGNVLTGGPGSKTKGTPWTRRTPHLQRKPPDGLTASSVGKWHASGDGHLEALHRNAISH